MKVYLITRPALAAGFREFLADKGVPDYVYDPERAAQEAVVAAGRICYDSFAAPRPGGPLEYIGHMLHEKHGSVIEHAVWGFVISGVSRALLAQLTRHRIGLSPSVRSQRYADESQKETIMPAVVRDDPDLAKAFRNAADLARETYRGLVEALDRKLAEQYPGWSKRDRRKAARESARYVLPEGTETELFLTGNARAWLHFLILRGARGVMPEIRELALKLHAILAAEAPAIFQDVQVVDDPDVGPVLFSRHGRA